MKRFNLNLIAGSLLLFALLPVMADACALCVGSSPFKTGMQWAVVLLLPVPFVLVGLLVYFIRQASQDDTTDS